MSLDVYLELDGAETAPRAPVIVIREDGAIREISREEWDQRFPEREPIYTPMETVGSTTVYSANITHNLGKMAAEAGIYKHLWRPEEINIDRAKHLIEPLREGLALLESDPDRFRALNPSNGWGTYEGLVEFVRGYLGACEEVPEATVRAWR